MDGLTVSGGRWRWLWWRSEGNRKYMRCLYVYNKIDTLSLDEVDRLAHTPDSVVLSCNWKLNLDYLLDQVPPALPRPALP
jgi:ribosome-interacting GTPase 1